MKLKGEGRRDERAGNCISREPEDNSRAIHDTVYTKIQIMQLVFCVVHPYSILF